MSTRKNRPDRRRMPWLKALGIAILALGILAGFVTLWRMGSDWLLGIDLSPAGIERLAAGWGAWAPMASILLMIAHSFVPFPAEAIAVANGMLFGPVYGTLVTWLGAMAGALLAYGIGRWLGRAAVERLVPARLHGELDRWSGYVRPGTLLAARLIPVISFNLINYGAGVAVVGLWTFLWTTALGILPLTILSVLIGHGALGWSPVAWLVVALGVAATLLAIRGLAGRWRRPTHGG